MCYTWKYPSTREEEMLPKEYEQLPRLDFANITGGEPFLRDDIDEILEVVRTKSKRTVISTNGLLTDRLVRTFEKFPDLGIRISLDGLPSTNEAVRGVPGGTDKQLRTLLTLKEMGIKDLGIGTTITGDNAKDLLHMFTFAEAARLEFATSVVHSSFYFHKEDNEIPEKEAVADAYRRLMRALLGSSRSKNWFRAYYVMGIINRIYGQPRPLPCKMATIGFFVDPFGEVLPCNMLKEPMGNLREQSFEEIWHGERAEHVRQLVRNCPEQCWMTGSASCAMREKVWIPALWVFKSKLELLTNPDWPWPRRGEIAPVK
jgi:radical SAM protein with 4Fe4S-binding SPASM domain